MFVEKKAQRIILRISRIPLGTNSSVEIIESSLQANTSVVSNVQVQ